MNSATMNDKAEYYQALSVIFGSLQRQYQKIPLNEANRALQRLGYDTMKWQTSQNELKLIQKDDQAYSLMKDAYDGKIGIDSLVPVAKIGEMVNDQEEPATMLETEPVIDDEVSPFKADRQKEVDDNTRNMAYQRIEARHQNALNDVFNRLAADLKQYTVDDGLNLPKTIVPTKSTKALIVTASDYHVGNSYRIKGNEYNYEILKQRVETYTAKAIEEAKSLGVDTVHFVFLGDLVEGINMRATNQAFYAEFNLAQQISNGIKLLVWQLQQFTKHFHVKFGVIEGNHDRLDGNKKSSIYSDGAMLIVLKQIQLLLEHGCLNNLEIMDNTDDIYNLHFKVGKRNVMCTHGETIKTKMTDNLAKHSQNERVDLLIGGHYHNFNAHEENHAGLVAISGSMKGFDMYSKTLNLNDSVASQLMIELDSNSVDLKTVWF